MRAKLDVAPEHWDNVFAPSSALAMITTVSDQGQVNAASYGTCTRVLHDPVCIAFACSPGSDTYDNLSQTGEFVVNLPPFEPEILSKVLQVGLPWKKGVDELAAVGLTALPSTLLRPPRIAECRTHFEVRVEWVHEWRERAMVCGEVVAVSADEGCVDERGQLVWSAARPAHYCGGRYQDWFVPAYEATHVEWDYRPLEDAGVSDEDFRSDTSMMRTLGNDWRDTFRSAPRTSTT